MFGCGRETEGYDIILNIKKGDWTAFPFWANLVVIICGDKKQFGWLLKALIVEQKSCFLYGKFLSYFLAQFFPFILKQAGLWLHLRLIFKILRGEEIIIPDWRCYSNALDVYATMHNMFKFLKRKGKTLAAFNV